MDPLTSAALTATLLAVWGYVTYLAVRRGVRDGLLDRDRAGGGLSDHRERGA